MSQATPPFGLDSSGHPPVEAISDYLEDLLPAEAAAELSEHLAGCPECLDTHAAIEEIRSLLGEAEPVQLPEDIAIRIDAALAAEALLSSTEPAAAPETASAPSRSLGGSRGTESSPGAAHGPSGPSDGSRGPGRKRRRPSARGLRRAALGLAALAVVGVVTASVMQIHPQSTSSGTASSGAVPRAAGQLENGARTGLVFTEATLAEQARQLVPADSPKAATGSAATEQSPAGASITVPDCVTLAAHRGTEQLLASAQGTYQGIAVFALIYRDTKDPDHTVDVYLVASSCATAATASPAQPGQVLLNRTVPRD
ncbi:putative zinc finger protein [Streptomyces sp. 846.5]|nr:zf-HC2 domain-containing protein [Streptomyces sp. 846.5]TDU05257.1 putative zinc finger protein [Streptomyces sp. 846.5]